MKTEDLEKMIFDPNTSQGDKDAALEELMKRLQEEAKAGGPEGASGEGGEESEIQKLLKKLMDGTITPEEMEKLKGLTGKSEEELKEMAGVDAGDPNDNSV
ncbi:hypothetical protein D3870_21225 [Noviherbaspirillum cavernae]|uniref:Uncharacterized protein n=2 Tax=Noviherbaspirillum cavernae TaxID=2320862 RepID=A0A418WWB7_9BURK|nr:hypothetical protein D3870_21225 [Noviherbaspirillum cavernae]